MDALQEAIRKIHSEPAAPTSRTLCALINSLDSSEPFDLNQLYQLNYSDFALALSLLKQWRLDSYRYERGWASRAASNPGAQMERPYWVPSDRNKSLPA